MTEPPTRVTEISVVLSVAYRGQRDRLNPVSVRTGATRDSPTVKRVPRGPTHQEGGPTRAQGGVGVKLRGSVPCRVTGHRKEEQGADVEVVGGTRSTGNRERGRGRVSGSRGDVGTRTGGSSRGAGPGETQPPRVSPLSAEDDEEWVGPSHRPRRVLSPSSTPTN